MTNVSFAATLVSEVRVTLIDWTVMVFVPPNDAINFGFQIMYEKVKDERALSVIWCWKTFRVVKVFVLCHDHIIKGVVQ